MAEEREEILIDLKINRGTSETEIDKLTKSIEGLRDANKALIAENQALEKAGQKNSQAYLDNTKAIEINRQTIQQSTTSRTALIKLTQEEDNSVTSLTLKNKLLVQERNKLDSTTREGAARIKEINSQLDINNAKIRENVSSLEKQKINIGNYASALDGVVPGMGGFISGMQGMIKSSLAFIATPIGATLAALGIAIAAVNQYLKGSEEGQDKAAKATAIANVAWQKYLQLVEKLGGAIVDFIEGGDQLVQKFGVIGRAIELSFFPLKLFVNGLQKISEWTGLDKQFDSVIEQGAKIAKMQDQIEARENELIVKREEINAKVLALREQAIKQEGEQKRKTIQEAIDLEKALAKEEAEQLQAKLKAFDMEKEASGALTEEEKKQRAELVAAIIKAESEGAQATIKFQKEIERLKDEQVANAAKRNEELAKLDEERIAQGQAVVDAEFERMQLKAENDIANLEVQKELKDQEVQIELDAMEEVDDAITRQTKFRQKMAEKNISIEQAQVGALSQIAAQGTSLFARHTVAYKVLASARAVMNTWLGVTEILKSQAAPFIEPFASIVRGIQVGITVASGLNAVKNINAVQFAQGGRADRLPNGVKYGTVGGKPHSEGGTKYYGTDGNVVELERNEGFYVAKVDAHQDFIRSMSFRNQRFGGNSWGGFNYSPKFALGGTVATGSGAGITNPAIIDQLVATTVSEMMANMPAPIVTVEDINAGQNRVASTENRARVL